MNIQEIEELEFNPRSEAQNCLAEAIALAHSIEPRQIGEGPYIIRTVVAVYCRATDGLAGTTTVEVRRFQTSQEGLQWWADQGSEENYDDEASHIFEGQFAADAHAAWANTPADDDGIPF